MEEPIEFYKHEIDDLQKIIRGQDTKIGYLFLICFLPINQLDYLRNTLKNLIDIQFIGNIFLVLLIIPWIISVIALIIGIFPRFNKKLIDTSLDVSELKKERNRLYCICKTKIICVRISLCSIALWTIILVLIIIGQT